MTINDRLLLCVESYINNPHEYFIFMLMPNVSEFADDWKRLGIGAKFLKGEKQCHEAEE